MVVKVGGDVVDKPEQVRTLVEDLVLINAINRGDFPAQSPLPSPPNRPVPPYLDTNGDGYLTSGDVLLVINYLNALKSGGGEGEGEGSMESLAGNGFASQSSTWVVDHRLDFGSLPTPSRPGSAVSADRDLWASMNPGHDHAVAISAILAEESDELEDLLGTLASDGSSDALASTTHAHRDWFSRFER